MCTVTWTDEKISESPRNLICSKQRYLHYATDETILQKCWSNKRSLPVPEIHKGLSLSGRSKPKALKYIQVRKDMGHCFCKHLANEPKIQLMCAINTDYKKDNRYLASSTTCTNFSMKSFTKQNRESTEGYSRWKVEKRHAKHGKTGLNKWRISKSQKAERNQVSRRVSVPC